MLHDDEFLSVMSEVHTDEGIDTLLDSIDDQAGFGEHDSGFSHEFYLGYADLCPGEDDTADDNGDSMPDCKEQACCGSVGLVVFPIALFGYAAMLLARRKR